MVKCGGLQLGTLRLDPPTGIAVGLACLVLLLMMIPTSLTIGSPSAVARSPGLLNSGANPAVLWGPFPTHIAGAVLYKVPVTITNKEGVATPAPFQQLIAVDSASYKSAEAANLSNGMFITSGGTVLDSWLESGNSYTSTHTLYWVKLPTALKAHASVTIYLAFVSPKEIAFNDKTTGEAPQLSSPYAKYDDGARVFSLYYNFSGSKLNTSEWIKHGVGAVVHDGITVSFPCSSSYCIAYLESRYHDRGLTAGFVMDTDVTDFVGTVAGTTNGVLGLSALSGSSGLGFSMNNNCQSTGGLGSDCVSTPGGTYPSITSYSVLSLGVNPAGSGGFVQLKYSHTQKFTATYVKDPLMAIWGNTFCCGVDHFVKNPRYQWMRLRTYPPDGVMPKSVAGALEGGPSLVGLDAQWVPPTTVESPNLVAANHVAMPASAELLRVAPVPAEALAARTGT
jgi:hypothetical protein